MLRKCIYKLQHTLNCIGDKNEIAYQCKSCYSSVLGESSDAMIFWVKHTQISTPFANSKIILSEKQLRSKIRRKRTPQLEAFTQKFCFCPAKAYIIVNKDVSHRADGIERNPVAVSKASDAMVLFSAIKRLTGIRSCQNL